MKEFISLFYLKYNSKHCHHPWGVFLFFILCQTSYLTCIINQYDIGLFLCYGNHSPSFNHIMYIFSLIFLNFQSVHGTKRICIFFLIVYVVTIYIFFYKFNLQIFMKTFSFNIFIYLLFPLKVPSTMKYKHIFKFCILLGFFTIIYFYYYIIS